MPGNHHANDLLGRIQTRQVKIVVIGLGYVGLPLALRFSEAGLKVTGIDTDAAKVSKLAQGQSYINYIARSAIQDAVDRGFRGTTDFSVIRDADVVIICVPTPLTKNREPDLHYVLDTAAEVAEHLRAGQLISLESTTYPGTTEENLRPTLESSGLRVGEHIFLVYSPERIDPGNKAYQIHDIPKIVGGCTPACRDLGEALYALAVRKVVPVSSTQAAELAKLLENIHRAVNIGLVNELKVVADSLGIDIFEVIDAAATKPFGFVPYYPGPGLGGHCIPIDPFYLAWKAKQSGVNARFIELAGEINLAMPDWVVSKAIAALQSRGVSVSGAEILILGIAYKKNVDDLRESPALELIDRFETLGAIVRYSDPFIENIPTIRRGEFRHSSVALTPASLSAADAVILVTDHDCFDYDLIVVNARIIIDTRGKFRVPASNVYRA
jgi:UDP-N-acetyl-D-glucosamine dehydrogenase